MIDSYDAAARTISGHFSASGKDDSGKPEVITDGKFPVFPSARGRKTGQSAMSIGSRNRESRFPKGSFSHISAFSQNIETKRDIWPGDSCLHAPPVASRQRRVGCLTFAAIKLIENDQLVLLSVTKLKKVWAGL
ncbi:hypothetical protein [Mesorhizobium caraganae]|uniref:hypothetical protein n=1 Tax=Mesorhizobium caraganae TaxID=483206 RepID=UPI001786EB4D|nr:hypothetical protein [Mesorhizobium caraganae]